MSPDCTRELRSEFTKILLHGESGPIKGEAEKIWSGFVNQVSWSQLRLSLRIWIPKTESGVSNNQRIRDLYHAQLYPGDIMFAIPENVGLVEFFDSRFRLQTLFFWASANGTRLTETLANNPAEAAAIQYMKILQYAYSSTYPQAIPIGNASFKTSNSSENPGQVVQASVPDLRSSALKPVGPESLQPIGMTPTEEMQKKDTEIARLRSELSNALSAFQDKDRECEQLRADLKSLRLERNANSSEIVALRQELQRCRRETQTLQAQQQAQVLAHSAQPSGWSSGWWSNSPAPVASVPAAANSGDNRWQNWEKYLPQLRAFMSRQLVKQSLSDNLHAILQADHPGEEGIFQYFVDRPDRRFVLFTLMSQSGMKPDHVDLKALLDEAVFNVSP